MKMLSSHAPPPAPTSEQCSSRERVVHGERTFHACWYPSTGGAVGRCLVEVVVGSDSTPDETEYEDCFDVWLWHDGEFGIPDDEHPRHLHHCSAREFVEFGEFVLGLTKRSG